MKGIAAHLHTSPRAQPVWMLIIQSSLYLLLPASTFPLHPSANLPARCHRRLAPWARVPAAGGGAPPLGSRGSAVEGSCCPRTRS